MNSYCNRMIGFDKMINTDLYTSILVIIIKIKDLLKTLL